MLELFEKRRQGRHFDLVDVVKEMDCKVLCFDELQVTDIADAMILKAILDALFKLGMSFVCTSNRAPDDLYKNGIQRDSFLPCIELLKTKCKVFHLDSGLDYRMQDRPLKGVFFYGTKGSIDFMDLVAQLTQGKAMESKEIQVVGSERTVTIQNQVDGFCLATFADLCIYNEMSSAEYMAICTTFHTILLAHIPQMDLSMRNEIRRFITLIDSCYDNRTRIVCSFQDPVTDLKKDLFLLDSYSKFDEPFAATRTISRLTEMSTEFYWHEKWNKMESTP